MRNLVFDAFLLLCIAFDLSLAVEPLVPNRRTIEAPLGQNVVEPDGYRSGHQPRSRDGLLSDIHEPSPGESEARVLHDPSDLQRRAAGLSEAEVTQKVQAAIQRSKARSQRSPARGPLPNISGVTPTYRYLRRAAPTLTTPQNGWYALYETHEPTGDYRLIVGMVAPEHDPIHGAPPPARPGPERRLDYDAFIYVPAWMGTTETRGAGWGMVLEEFRVLPGLRLDYRTTFLGRCLSPSKWIRDPPEVVSGITKREFVDRMWERYFKPFDSGSIAGMLARHGHT